MKNTYYVSYRVIYSDTVYAENPEEAADIVEAMCPYDIDGFAHVVNIDTDEEWEI